jgi:hypothetical protein
VTPRPKPRAGQKSELDKMREQTKYSAHRIVGHAPFPVAAMGDGMRITGLAGGRLLSLLIVKATGRRVAKDEAFLEVTEPLSIAQLAELCCLDERTIQREVKDQVTRKIIKATMVKKGLYEFQPLFRTWADLPDYLPGPMVEPEADEDDTDIDVPETATKGAGVTKITRKPVRIAAGKASKPVKVECGVSALEFSADVDAECTAVVQDGVLRVNLQCAEQAKSVPGQTSRINKLDSPPRQASRGNSSEPEKGGRRISGEIAVNHPRAAELSALFDGPIYQSCKKTLSGDPVALKKACQSVGDVPHEYLVDFLEGRAERKILPMHVPSICSEALHCWEKSKDLPAQPKKLTREEMDEMVRVDREARIARQKQRAS